MENATERRRPGEGKARVYVFGGGGRDFCYGGGAGDWWVHFALAGVTRLRVITWLCTHPGEHTRAEIERGLGLTATAPVNALMAMRYCGLVSARMERMERGRGRGSIRVWRWSVTEDGRRYLWRYGWVTGRLAPGSWRDGTFEGRVDVCPCDVLARDAVPSLLRPLAMAVAYALWVFSPVALRDVSRTLEMPDCHVLHFLRKWEKRGWVRRDAAAPTNFRVTRRRPRWTWSLTAEGIVMLERHVRALRWAAQNAGYDVPPDDRFLLGEDRASGDAGKTRRADAAPPHCRHGASRARPDRHAATLDRLNGERLVLDIREHREVGMAKFEGGLQEWRRYMDERTRAVRDRREGRGTLEADAPETDVAEAEAPPEGAASEEVEAILAKHRAIADEINRPAPPPRAPVAPAVPGVDPDIVEAAQMFAQLPRHIQYLVRPADTEEEVAQNSYKSKFTETRQELVRRLLDPQLSLEETARVLNVCPTTVRRYTNRGLLKQERTPGNHRRFRLSDVLAFLEDHGASDDPATD